MKLKFGNDSRYRNGLSFFSYLKIFFSGGFGWLILFIISLCGLIYLFEGRIK